MSFLKKNLLRKIAINRLSAKVSISINLLDAYTKIDIRAMKKLLEYTTWSYVQKRDLHLYLDGNEESYRQILVLDNDLTIYNTTISDVLIRKSPNLKEMLNIKNAIKILRDEDVVFCKKDISVEYIKNLCIDALELSFCEADIDQIVFQGVSSLNKQDYQGVEESIDLFSELLSFDIAPKAFYMENHKIWGLVKKEKSSGEHILGPKIIIHRNTDGLIVYIQDSILRSRDKNRFDTIEAILSGDRKGLLATNAAVFYVLKENVMDNLI